METPDSTTKSTKIFGEWNGVREKIQRRRVSRQALLVPPGDHRVDAGRAEGTIWKGLPLSVECVGNVRVGGEVRAPQVLADTKGPGRLRQQV
jgi:hypothetical protein